MAVQVCADVNTVCTVGQCRMSDILRPLADIRCGLPRRKSALMDSLKRIRVEYLDGQSTDDRSLRRHDRLYPAARRTVCRSIAATTATACVHHAVRLISLPGQSYPAPVAPLGAALALP